MERLDLASFQAAALTALQTTLESTVKKNEPKLPATVCYGQGYGEHNQQNFLYHLNMLI